MGKAQAESDSSAAAMLPHYNMWDPEHEKAKWDVFSYARRDCPVAHTDADGGGQYVVTRYEDVRRVLEDPQTFSSAGVAPRPSPVRLNPLDSDPPYQVELRKILNPLFTRSFLLRFEPELRKNATDLIGRFIDNGRFEFVREFAGPFVGNALSRVVFNEDDPQKMDHAAEVVIRVAVEATDEAFFELAVLAGQYIAEREANPVERDDVLNAIATGTVDGGRPLTDEERLGVVTVLFLGGLDTTRGAMGSIAYHLASRPELEQRLRDPAWIRQDMDEFIRLESPVGCLGRTATRDVELGGVMIGQGEQLLVRFDSANRDEARFEDASRLRLDVRRGSSAGFGLGIHRCLGSHFARIQIAIAFDELFKRVTNLRFADPGAEVQWAPGIANGPEALDLLFDVID
jgi:cytochrome P450